MTGDKKQTDNFDVRSRVSRVSGGRFDIVFGYDGGGRVVTPP
jgi:hypothetical protein